MSAYLGFCDPDVEIAIDDRPPAERLTGALLMVSACEESAARAATEPDRLLWLDHAAWWRTEARKRSSAVE